MLLRVSHDKEHYASQEAVAQVVRQDRRFYSLPRQPKYWRGESDAAQVFLLIPLPSNEGW